MPPVAQTSGTVATSQGAFSQRGSLQAKVPTSRGEVTVDQLNLCLPDLITTDPLVLSASRQGRQYDSVLVDCQAQVIRVDNAYRSVARLKMQSRSADVRKGELVVGVATDPRVRDVESFYSTATTEPRLLGVSYPYISTRRVVTRLGQPDIHAVVFPDSRYAEGFYYLGGSAFVYAGTINGDPEGATNSPAEPVVARIVAALREGELTVGTREPEPGVTQPALSPRLMAACLAYPQPSWTNTSPHAVAVVAEFSGCRVELFPRSGRLLGELSTSTLSAGVLWNENPTMGTVSFRTVKAATNAQLDAEGTAIFIMLKKAIPADSIVAQ